MDKLLSFLFRETSNGATYLQTILMFGLLFAGLFYLFKTFKEVIDNIKSEERGLDNEKDSTKSNEDM